MLIPIKNIIVRESDSSPNVVDVREIIVPNGSLTDNGSGSVTLAFTTGSVTSVAATAPAAGFTISGSPITSSGTFVFALADDLAALEGISSTGIAARTASNTWTVRTITGTSNEITITDGDGVSGNPTISLPSAITLTGKTLTGGTLTTPTINVNDNVLSIRDNGDTTKILQFQVSGVSTGTTRTLTVPDASGTIALTTDLSSYQPLDATLTALAAYNTNGLLTQTSADTFTGRTVTGTASRISITNGNGVSGNPTIDIDSGYVGQTSITTLGTIGTGTWNGTVVTGQYGGTGVANTGKTITLGGNLTTSGAFATTLTSTATTNVTLPTTGTLSTLAGSESLTNKKLGSLTSNGFVKTSGGDGTLSVDTTSYQTLDANLTALAAYNTNGILTQTTHNVFVGRTITGTSNEVTVTNGDGIAGNPTISLPSSLTFTGKTITGGTFTTPTINVNDDVFSLRDNGDTTKVLQFQLSGITTSTTRTLTVPNASGTIALTSDLTSGYQPLDSTLTSLASYNTNGLLTQTSADTFTGRTITGTSNRLSVTNGNGVSGNPTLDIDSAYVGQTSITTLGTIATGTWSGTTIALNKGGTGATTQAGAANAVLPTQTGNSGKVLGTDGSNVSWVAASTGTVTSVNLTAPAAGITVSGGPITTSGSITLTLADDLAAVEGISTSGMVARTASNTWTTRTITGGTAISVSNGDGISGNPTINNTGVTALTGTSNQVTVSASTGSVTLSLPQNIHTNASPSFTTVSVSAWPTDYDEVTPRSYVSSIREQIPYKKAVRVATTANITRSNEQTIDGVSVVAGDRVLVKNQSTASQNGIFVCVSGGAWTYADDFDNQTYTDPVTVEATSEVFCGIHVYVEEGTTNAKTEWVLTTANPITLNSTSLVFEQTSGLGQVTAGAGLTKTANTLDVGTASASRIVVNADNIDLATTGVSASTYKSVTVDVYGRVTAGTNPTTLAGYGITDAQPIDATLTSLAAYNTNGLLTQTSADTFTGRTITGTSNRISISNGNGVSGNPTIDIDSAYVGQATITTLGTITTGTWTGTTIAVANGGTGQTSYTNGQLLIGNTTGNTLTKATLTAPAAGISITNGTGSITFALTNDLSAVEGLASNGLATRTASDTWTVRTLTGTANELTVTNGDGVSGNPTISIPSAVTLTGKTLTGGTFTTPTINVNDDVFSIRDNADTTKILQFQLSGITTGTTRTLTVPNSSGTIALTSDLSSGYQPLDATLTALAAYNTNGILTQTAADTFTGRTITGTLNRISISNGNGVSGNPTIDIDSAYVGQATITTLGTIGTGVWQGTVISSTYGGTGINNAGRTLTINTNSGTITFSSSSLTLTVAAAASVSGTNTGDQTITLTGDVTGSGTGSFAATIASGAVSLAKMANLAANSVIGNTTGGATTPTAVSLSSASSASSVILRDSSANAFTNNFLDGYTTTATAAGTTTLTVASTRLQFFTGSTTQNCDLPVVSTLALGHTFEIVNSSSGNVTVRSSGANTVQVMAANTRLIATSNATSGTSAAVWTITYIAAGGAGTVTSVNLTQPAAGITVSGGPVTSSGSITLALANDLAAVEGLSSNGIAARTATDTWTVRTITGTSNRLTVTNGDGVSGNPTLDISSAYVGQATITTLGTITTGTWTGTTIAVANGGTGTTTAFTAGSIVFAGASGVYSQSNSNLFWDNTNFRLGIGTASPAQKLDVNAGTVKITNNADNTSPTAILMANSGSGSSTGAKIQFPYNNIEGRYNGMTFTNSGSATDYLSFGVNIFQYSGNNFQFASGINDDVTFFSGASAGYKLIFKSPGDIKFNTYSGSFTDKMVLSQNGDLTLTPSVRTGGSPTLFTITGSAHTTLAASTEATDINLNLARTVQFATGALTTQRAIRVQAPTYGFVGSSTITTASTMEIESVPVAGTNATITNQYGLRISAGVAAGIPLVLKAAGSQTGNLLQLQNSSGTALSCFDSAGKLILGASSGSYRLTCNTNDDVPAYIGNTTTGNANMQAGCNISTIITGTNSYSSIGRGTHALYVSSLNQSSTNHSCIFILPQVNYSGNGGNSTITNMAAIDLYQAYGYNSGYTTTITNLYGINVRAYGGNTTGQTVTNSYGIYIEGAALGTNKYSLFVNTGSSTSIGVVVKAAASQSVNLQEWQNSSGTVIGKVDSIGYACFGSSGAALNGCIVADTGAGSANFNGLQVRNSPATSYTGILYVNNWSDGNGGDWLYMSNATSNTIFKIDNRGRLNIKNTGLRIADTDSSHYLSIVPGSNITADRTLTVTTGDADRTLTINSSATVSSNTAIATITFIIDGGGATIATGVKGDLEIPFDCTINQVTMLADQSGSIVVDIWKDVYGSYPPVVGDSITASAKPTISSATKSQDATLTGWTTSITAGNTLRFNVDSATTIQRVTISLKVTKT